MRSSLAGSPGSSSYGGDWTTATEAWAAVLTDPLVGFEGVTITPKVPTPATLALSGVGLLGVGYRRRRQ